MAINENTWIRYDIERTLGILQIDSITPLEEILEKVSWIEQVASVVFDVSIKGREYGVVATFDFSDVQKPIGSFHLANYPATGWKTSLRVSPMEEKATVLEKDKPEPEKRAV